MRSALVLTGIDGPKQVLAAEEPSRPDFLLDDLRQLFEPYEAATATERRGGAVDTRVGSAVVRRDGSTLTVLDEGARRIDLLRAGSAAIWSSGLKIYGLRVPPELYS
jgi:glycerol-1-phosphatase